jgi:hypothetical protein
MILREHRSLLSQTSQLLRIKTRHVHFPSFSVVVRGADRRLSLRNAYQGQKGGKSCHGFTSTDDKRLILSARGNMGDCETYPGGTVWQPLPDGAAADSSDAHAT